MIYDEYANSMSARSGGRIACRAEGRAMKAQTAHAVQGHRAPTASARVGKDSAADEKW